MTPERWARIKEVCGAAMEKPKQERGVWLDSECGRDDDLRAEVERLLAQDDASLRSPISASPARATPKLAIGDVLSHYCVEAKVGEGGMGAVYKAYDSQLRRRVALKVLPPEHLVDAESKQRLLREARAASTLNHPNIVAIYEVGCDNEVDFIAMEFVEGKSLREVIPAQGLLLSKALDYAAQIADALAKAHAAGVVHRDLKPANIMVTPDGLVKLLDFGLAQRVRLQQDDTTLTLEGDILGTPAYMSPEQAEGKPLDARADVFSFGVVLYEMLAGRQPFSGDSVASVLAAVLREQPLPLGTKIPLDLQKVVARCLHKDPARRFQHMDDVRVALKELQEESDSGGAAGAGLFLSRTVKSVGAGLGILGLGVTLMIAFNVGNWRGWVFPQTAAPRIESLVVLPVKNFSGDAGQEFFADGMTDALIAGLAQIRAVKVISLTSAMHYKGTTKTLPQIAGELGVDGVVEASLMRSGGRVRITAELLDARQDRHLWASNYEREMTDVLTLQSEVVQAIADEIRVELTPQESKRLKTARRVDPEVYDTTLKARAILEYATREEEVRRAIGLFRKAVDQDPTYAPAWAGFGEALWSQAAAGFEFVAPAEVRDQAIAAAEKALALDENLPDAHKARAVIATDGDWDLEKAQQHFEKALELRPGYAAAHNLYEQILEDPLLRFDEARRHLDRARELDPLSPWNDQYLLTWWCYQGRPEKVLEEGERARQRNPTFWAIRWPMGGARLVLGQPEQAAAEYEAALSLVRPDRPAAVLGTLGLAYGLAGRRTDALRILAEMEQASHRRYISPFYLAAAYSGLGKMDEAFRLLDQALDQRTPYLIFCTPHDPIPIALRRDPRWKPFIERVRKLVRLPPGTPDPYS